jgi:hypothetical protein
LHKQVSQGFKLVALRRVEALQCPCGPLLLLGRPLLLLLPGADADKQPGLKPARRQRVPAAANAYGRVLPSLAVAEMSPSR